MKNLYYIVLALFLVQCNSENAPDCIQATGQIRTTEFTVATFTKIVVWEQVQLFVEQGPIQKVVIESGENLLSDIEVTVTDGQLHIYNNNRCNFIRDYDVTKVYVTAPDITEIRSSSGFAVKSVGVLTYPSLTLLSEDQGVPNITHTNGDFELQVVVENLTIIANGFSRFYINGIANRANAQFFSGGGALIAPNLAIQHLQVFHRSSTDFVVYPLQSIEGSIVSVGNIICKNRPPVIQVEAPYVGQLIFE